LPAGAERAGWWHLGPRFGGVDQLAPLGGVFRRDQGRQRHVPHRRIGVIGLAVGEGQFQRLGQVVDIIGAVVADRLDVGAFEQGQGLQQHRALAPRAASENFQVAKAAALGRADRRVVIGEIVGRQQPALFLVEGDEFLGDIAS
jgi:hypothetical protein